LDNSARSEIECALDWQEMLRRMRAQVGALGRVVPQQWNGPRKLDTESRYAKSTLSRSDAVSDVELFEQVYTVKSVALTLERTASR